MVTGHADGAGQAEAWCEAIIRRIFQIVDAGTAAEETPAEGSVSEGFAAASTSSRSAGSPAMKSDGHPVKHEKHPVAVDCRPRPVVCGARRRAGHWFFRAMCFEFAPGDRIVTVESGDPTLASKATVELSRRLDSKQHLLR